MKWTAHAPSNIALIKYMGKSDGLKNQPMNSSLSYTLPHLLSFVELEELNDAIDQWQPLQQKNCPIFKLSHQAQQRYLKHLQFLKQYFGYEGNFIIRSSNNFPADCGLASSASSFAALTRCACTALSALTNKPMPTTEQQAHLSRQGSGSSGRSFFSPWSIWKADEITSIEVPYSDLIHQVIVVTKLKKPISSSQAHREVITSALFQHRPERANERLKNLLSALEKQQWRLAYEICWQEFWDMHALFETAQTPFGYMTHDSLIVLHWLRDFWQQNNDGPLITLDAGPNIHLLYRTDQQAIAQRIKNSLAANYFIIN
jgi:diphosphomevalonate decarboxylase